MNFSKKLVLCVAFMCVASFAQQPPTTKNTTQSSPVVATVVKSDSQKTLKKVIDPDKPPTTWTKIKDLFM